MKSQGAPAHRDNQDGELTRLEHGVPQPDRYIAGVDRIDPPVLTATEYAAFYRNFPAAANKNRKITKTENSTLRPHDYYFTNSNPCGIAFRKT